MDDRITRTMENLRKNRMEVHYVDTKAEVANTVKSLMPENATVAFGGSVTLQETGVIDMVHQSAFSVLDRYAPDLSRAEIEEIFRRSFAADVYLTSTNAITEKGELYNVDGNANRVAAIAYGPQSVIIVAGVNKIVPDLAAAIHRVKTVAAPRNAKRLHCDTYCAKTGYCRGLEGDMTDGCGSPERICSEYLVSGFQRKPNRIKIVLVGEDCGY